jgi:hydrogenase nickel incorporation protein HypB
MCTNCGCQGDGVTVTNLQTGATTPIDARHDHDEHSHAHHQDRHHGHGHSHSHEHEHSHSHGHSHDHAHRADRVIDLKRRLLDKNDAAAARTRARLSGREIVAVNLMSSPGAGKTTLLERTIVALAGELPLSVIEGDQATANDGERIRTAGAPAVQVNTGTGCHLDAEMVARGLSELKPGAGSIVFIENVGNLVCPALFDLGERGRVVIFSVTEGEDKPLKYPHIFQVANLVILSKVDLVPHLDFDMKRARDNVRTINPGAPIVELSARTGQGMQVWLDWLRRAHHEAQQSAFA